MSFNISVDSLFPEGKYKTRTNNKKLDIDILFKGTTLNDDPNISFSSDKLLDKIKKRRKNKLKKYNEMLRYCYQRIEETDNNNDTDLVFNVIKNIPDCKEYIPSECLEYISLKLRTHDLDTKILSDTAIFITWKYLELKKENNKQV
jgi:hypothetical protein